MAFVPLTLCGGDCHPAIVACVGPPPPPLDTFNRFPVYTDGVRMGVLVLEPGVLGGVVSVWAAYLFRVRPPTCVSPLGRFFFRSAALLGKKGFEPFPCSILTITLFSVRLSSSPGSRREYVE